MRRPYSLISLRKKIIPPPPEEELEQLGFSLSLIESFIQAIKQAIAWKEEEVPKKTKFCFPFLQKRQAYFPFMDEIKDVIK